MKKLPRIISQEEFEKLIAANIKQERKSKARKQTLKHYRLAMILGFEAGMRISEIVGLKFHSPERQRGEQDTRSVSPSGDAWRIQPLSKEQVEDASIRILSGKGKKDRVVPRPKKFNQAAKSMLPLKIQRRALQHYVTRLGKEVLDKKISFHTLRHGFATMLLDKGFALHEVQMFMGHSRLDTTGIYLHASPTKALDKYKEVF